MKETSPPKTGDLLPIEETKVLKTTTREKKRVINKTESSLTAILSIRIDPTKLPRNVDDGLAARAPHVVIRGQGILDRFSLPPPSPLPSVHNSAEQAVQHGGIFERLRGAVPCERQRGVGCVAEDRHNATATSGVSNCFLEAS